MEPRSKLLDATVSALAIGLLSAVKRMDRKRTANFAGAMMRKIGPLFPERFAIFRRIRSRAFRFSLLIKGQGFQLLPLYRNFFFGPPPLRLTCLQPFVKN